jgi:hypothetical protein
MDDVTTRQGVALAMVYEEGFASQIPTGWQRLGVLYLARPRITAAASEVAFYATAPSSVETLTRRLAAFATTLPPEATFVASQPGET